MIALLFVLFLTWITINNRLAAYKRLATDNNNNPKDEQKQSSEDKGDSASKSSDDWSGIFDNAIKILGKSEKTDKPTTEDNGESDWSIVR